MNVFDQINLNIATLDYHDDLEKIGKIHRAQPNIDLLVTAYVELAFRDKKKGEVSSVVSADGNARAHSATVYWRQLLSKLLPAPHPIPLDPSKISAELVGALPFYQIELSLINRIGPNISRILDSPGASLTLELLFKDDLMTRWYREGVTFQIFYKQIRTVLNTLMLDCGKRWSILEVGGGTGGLTFHLQDLLGKNVEFTFTDSSKYFLRLARTYFPNSSFKYKTFDLEKKHTDENFQAGEFDIILANNVLHDTKNIDFTLKNLRGLLKPDGYLIMLELVEPQTWWHLCFGSLDGWWRFKLDSADRRKGLMVMSDEEWVASLLAAGYSDARNVSKTTIPNFSNCVIVARNGA